MTTLLAVDANVPGDFSFYNFVLFVHIASALVAFGGVFIYPVFFRLGIEHEPRGLPLFHRVQRFVGPVMITGGATLALLAGIYLAAKGPFGFEEPFVGAGILIILIILALGGAFFARQERRLSELIERDISAAGAGEVQLSDEYVDIARRVELVGILSSGLVLLAVLLMVFKPGT